MLPNNQRYSPGMAARRCHITSDRPSIVGGDRCTVIMAEGTQEPTRAFLQLLLVHYFFVLKTMLVLFE